MNNVKTILSALLMLASSLYSVAQGAPTAYAKALLVTTADGTQTKFALKEKPQLTIEKPYLVVNVNGTRINFELEEMLSLKYINVPVVLGDAYEDGFVNATDVTTMANYLMGKRAAGFNFSNADANNDETVNIADIVTTGKHIIKSTPNSQGVSQSRSQTAVHHTPSNDSGQRQHALYNYRNDGDFNAWPNKDIEHIIYSNIDIQGVEQGDIVVQEVWTSDSVYRVPLEVVDSIGFRAPAPEYQDNVFHITVQHLPYVTNVDQLSITFSSNLPANMRPQVGMVITSDTFEEPLSKGFAGKIVDINEDGSSLNVICETATVTDVFKKLILVGNAQAIDEEVAKSRPLRTTRGIFDEYEEGNQTEFEFPGKFTVKIIDFISITDEVKVSADYYIYVDLPKFKVRATVTGTHDLKTSWSIDTDKILEWLGHEKEKHEPEWATPVWPIVNIPGIFNFGIRAGAFLAPSVKLSITGSTPLTFTHTFGVEFSNIDTWLIPIVTPVMNAHSELGTPDITVSLEGKLFAGIALGLKTTLIGDNVLSGDITGRFGPEFEAKIEMKQKLGEDDHFNLYSLMKDSKIGVQLKADAKVKTMVFGDNLTEKLEWDWKWPIPGWEDSRYLFPDFTKPELPFWAMPNPLSMYSKPSRDVIMPVQLGIGLFDKDGVKQKEYYCDDWYLLENDNRNIPQIYLGDVPSGTTYTCRPMFNFLGLGEIVAEPRTTFTVPNPVSLEVSSLYLNKGGTKDITLSGGWGNYQLANSNDKSVMASFNHPEEESEGDKMHATSDGTDGDGGESWKPSFAWNSSWPTEETPTIHISGIDSGEATIMVRDMRSKETALVKVVVIDENTIPLELSLASLDLTAGKQGTVEITSGSGNYTAVSSDTEVATVEVSDGIIQVTAIKAGKATITVTDTESSLTATIEVTVKEEEIPYIPVKTETFVVKDVPFTMVAVEGGTFMMGSPDDDSEADSDEKPRHQVTLSSFAIGETEVTQALWEAVMGSNPSPFEDDSSCPVDMVSWEDCQTFISKLNDLTGQQFHLPTEAQWEYAARGGNKSLGYKYSGSNDIESVAWYADNSGRKTHPVKTKAPNELGIYDMSGNVWEWCSDWYGSYSSESQTNPKGASSGSGRVTRGGFSNSGTNSCRSTCRGSVGPSDRFTQYGLRLALSGDGNNSDQGNHEWVDLGLPSGTLWASCNVGASSPEEFGGYYSWGETVEKSDYSWDAYSLCTDGDSNTCVDIGDIAGTQYDVAHVRWGGPWTMPTLSQMDELIKHCSSEWTEVNGVKGRKYTGPNGNSIFLPATGYIGKSWSNSNSDDYSVSSAGTYGVYQTSTLKYNKSDLYVLFFGSSRSDLYNDYYNYACYRATGRCVRPVISKSQ